MNGRKSAEVRVDTLNSLRERLHAAILLRSAKDPAEFATNLTFLKEMDNIFNDYLRLVDTQAGDPVYPTQRADCSGSLVMFKPSLIPAGGFASVKEVREKLFTPALKELFKKEMAKDPRINDLNIERDSKAIQIIGEDGRPQEVMANILTYQITYSDNTLLVFHTLTDKAILTMVENTYNAKMAMLSMAMNHKIHRV